MSPPTVIIHGLRLLADDIDNIVGAPARRVDHVQLWRELSRDPDEWLYLGPFPPRECRIDPICLRFGGGWYRAKLCDRRGRVITGVRFGIDELAWPVTGETRERIRRHRER